MSNTTCSNSPNAMPDLRTLPIPQNITFGAIPTSNGSMEAMLTCCEPKPVHVASGCYEWCELTPRYTNGSVPAEEVVNAFTRCIGSSGRGRGIVQVHMASETGRSAPTTGGFFTWALLAVPKMMGLI